MRGPPPVVVRARGEPEEGQGRAPSRRSGEEVDARQFFRREGATFRKRDVVMSLALLQGLQPVAAAFAADADVEAEDADERKKQEVNLQRQRQQQQQVAVPEGMKFFTDDKNLFRLAYPEGWEVVNKAGATLLLRDPAEKYSQIGVTVSPVKISSLSEFGSVHDIGEKLLRAEAAKESTVPGGVTLISESQREGAASATTFYDYDYRLVTTHGNKRVLNSVAVENNTLYIMNAQVYEKCEEEMAPKYARVAGTFDVGRAAVDRPQLTL